LKEARKALAEKDDALQRLEERLAKVELKQERVSPSSSSLLFLIGSSSFFYAFVRFNSTVSLFNRFIFFLLCFCSVQFNCYPF